MIDGSEAAQRLMPTMPPSRSDCEIHPPRQNRRRQRPLATSTSSSSLRASSIVLLSIALASLLLLPAYPFAESKEIVATSEWQRLSENDTVPAGLHVRMDLSTGEKWAKLVSDDDDDENIKASVAGDDGGEGGKEAAGAGRVASAVMDASGALSIIEDADSKEDKNGGADNSNNKAQSPPPERDYEMMHRVMSQLPPSELEKFGGLPELPAPQNATPSSTPTRSQLTAEQLLVFESKMEELWTSRQAALAKAQESVADLPSMLKDRIGTLAGYLEDVDGSLRSLLQERAAKEEDEEDDGGVVFANNIIEALRDLEYQLADVDMARDFHTLGGWPVLVSLLDDGVHRVSTASDANVEEEEEAMALVDEIRALAAMTVGTAVGNLGEFRSWALEDVAPSSSSSSSPTSALSLLLASFQTELDQRTERMAGGSMAIATPSSARYKARATYKLRAVYALGAMLRGNPAAQQYFVLHGGAEALASDVLGTLSTVRGKEAKAMVKLDYKFASKVLALGGDVVTDVVLHPDAYDDVPSTMEEKEGSVLLTANRLVGAFTSERWCDLSLRMLATPSDAIGAIASRNAKERALGAVRAFGPGCQAGAADDNNENDDDGAKWGLEEVKRVRSEWNREGANDDDGLDSVYRRELLDLADGVLEALLR